MGLVSIFCFPVVIVLLLSLPVLIAAGGLDARKPEIRSLQTRGKVSFRTQKADPRAAGGGGYDDAHESAPFQPGPFAVKYIVIPRHRSSEGPPKTLQVFAPASSASTSATSSAPVVVFQHGFNLMPQFYSELLSNVSSHGFLVVAPQMYDPPYVGFDATGEIKDATVVIQWLRENLESYLPSADLLAPDLENLTLAGHSRGGKVAYGVALGLGGDLVNPKALALIDPVDGTSLGQTKPKILTYVDGSIYPWVPVLVVGTGLGPKGLTPCAPRALGHAQFYNDTAAPVYHVTASDFGHGDMLNDVTEGWTYWAISVCKAGGARLPMRSLTAGLMVALIRDALGTEPGLLTGILGNPDALPVAVEDVAWRLQATVTNEAVAVAR